MNTKLLGLAFLIAYTALLGGPAAAASTSYFVTDTIGDLTLEGSIVTDGTVGALGASNILSYDLSISGLGTPLSIINTNPANTLDLTGGDVIASATTLSFNFSDSSFGLFDIGRGGADGGSFQFLSAGALCSYYSECSTFGSLDLRHIGNGQVGAGGTYEDIQTYETGTVEFGRVLDPQGCGESGCICLVCEIGTPGPNPSNTPLPAALPLFASGFGVVGLLLRRRKRQAQAAV